VFVIAAVVGLVIVLAQSIAQRRVATLFRNSTVLLLNLWQVGADGGLTNRRDFAKLAGFKQGPNGPTSGADGLVVDEAGRVYVATNAGVEIFSPDGQALGTIALPKQPQNLAFGGKEHGFLYAVGRGSVFRIATQTHGVNRPGK